MSEMAAESEPKRGVPEESGLGGKMTQEIGKAVADFVGSKPLPASVQPHIPAAERKAQAAVPREHKDAQPACEEPSRWPSGPRSGAVYVLAHGAQTDKETFVPEGVTVQFYVEEGKVLDRQAPVLRLLGVSVAIPEAIAAGGKINNYRLGPHAVDALMGYVPLLQRLPEDEVLILGSKSSLRGVKVLCSEQDCLTRFKTTGKARHLDKCMGLFGPRNAMYLGAVTHLLSCRARPVSARMPPAPVGTGRAVLNGILNGVIRRKENLGPKARISPAVEDKFWSELTPEDIYALKDPAELAAVLNFRKPGREQYLQRERSTPSGYRVDPDVMEEAVRRLRRTVETLGAAAETESAADLTSAQVTAVATAEAEATRQEKPPLDSAEKDAVALKTAMACRTINTYLAKAVRHIVTTTEDLLPMIDNHRRAVAVERKGPAPTAPAASPAPPAAPRAAPAEAKAAAGQDPLAGISLLRQQLRGELESLSKSLDQAYPASEHPALRAAPVYLRWRDLLAATKAFLTDEAIARPMAKDTISEHSNR
ncbi:putative adhesin [Streptomyces sp. NPDC055085]